MPEIVVHHLEQSRSHRVLWTLEALSLPYTVKRYERNAKTMRADPALEDVHPLGKSPVITVDGTVIAETGAILEHLSDLADGALRPDPGTEDAIRCRYFLHYAEGSLMPPLLVKLIIGRVRQAPLPFFVKPIAKAIANKVDETFTNGEVDKHTAFLEGQLSGREFFAGPTLTLADIQMSYPIEALLHRGDASAAPNLAAWLGRMKSRDDYRRALERGGDTNLIPG